MYAFFQLIFRYFNDNLIIFWSSSRLLPQFVWCLSPRKSIRCLSMLWRYLLRFYSAKLLFCSQVRYFLLLGKGCSKHFDSLMGFSSVEVHQQLQFVSFPFWGAMNTFKHRLWRNLSLCIIQLKYCYFWVVWLSLLCFDYGHFQGYRQQTCYQMWPNSENLGPIFMQNHKTL